MPTEPGSPDVDAGRGGARRLRPHRPSGRIGWPAPLWALLAAVLLAALTAWWLLRPAAPLGTAPDGKVVDARSKANPAGAARPEPAQGAAAAAVRRYALVIGNGRYKDSPLPNPERDAQLIAQTLESLGFEVQQRTNLNANDLRIALTQFIRRANDGRTDALFYYAGHGMRIGDRNYLLPVDANLRDVDEAQALAIDLSTQLLAEVQPESPRARVFVIDACRDNPFAGQPNGARVGRGLVQADTSGSKIAFSAGPGQAAEDGPEGSHSVYARALAEQMKHEGVELDLVLRRVREQVYRETQKRQQPWDGGNMLPQFFFNPAKAGATAQLPTAGLAAPQTLRLQLQADALLNTDQQERAASLALRIYLLRDGRAVRQAPFDSLYDNDELILGSALVRREQLHLRPGEARELSLPLSDDTRFLAVVAAYRELGQSQWRSVMELTPGTTSATVRLQAQARGVQLTWVP